MIEIMVDDRESQHVANWLRRRGEVDVRVHRMRYGDYLVNGRLIVERKTAHDFVVSLIDGRLLSQAATLAKCGTRAAIILEGLLLGNRIGSMSRAAIQGAVLAITVQFGLPLLRTRDAEETAEVLTTAANQISRHAHGALSRPGFRPHGTRKRQLYVLQGLPGIGPMRAARLLDTFGSLDGVFGAYEDDLADVPGIGPDTAHRIRQLILAHT